MTQNLILQTKKRPRSVKSVKTLGFYYKLRVGELARRYSRSSTLPRLSDNSLCSTSSAIQPFEGKKVRIVWDAEQEKGTFMLKTHLFR